MKLIFHECPIFIYIVTWKHHIRKLLWILNDLKLEYRDKYNLKFGSCGLRRILICVGINKLRRKERGREGHQNVNDNAKPYVIYLSTMGEGGFKNPQNSVNVVYECPQCWLFLTKLPILNAERVTPCFGGIKNHTMSLNPRWVGNYKI